MLSHLLKKASPVYGVLWRGGVLTGILILLSACDPLGHVGTDTCLACHNGSQATDMTMFTESSHAAVGCEACHGPGALHVRNGGRYGLFVNDAETVRGMCSTCHAREEEEFRASGHARLGILECIDCHNPHEGKTTVLSAGNNHLCLQCHAYRGFGTVSDIVAHTYHAYEPELSGQSRCITCHMVPTDRLDQEGSRSHTLAPVPPVESNLAGVMPAPPNTCAGMIGCHDGSIPTAPVFDVDDPADNDYLQVLYEIRYGG